ncbi:hypothetical protein [Mucilaginibacter sp. HD30]
MKILLLFISFALLKFGANGQIKVYKIVDRIENADIDYKKLDHLNSLGAGYHLLDKAFKPQKGRFTVYRFICTFKGLSHETEKQKVFHDLIILKTDKKNNIVDGYQYTLEWVEVPFTFDLYRIAKKDKKLTDGLDIKNLVFTRVGDLQTQSQVLGETGVLHL